MRWVGVLVIPLMLSACKADPPPENEDPWVDDREPCAQRSETRNLYWGDLHVHTALSFDAWLNDVRVEPEQAYAFAKGDAVALAPLDAEGQGTQTLQLDRPLDFAAVTDHAEYLAEVQACIDPDSPAYETEICQTYRTGSNSALTSWGLGLNNPDPVRRDALCGDEGIDCPEVAKDVWSRLVDAADEAYDRSEACEFTSFVAYEWSGSLELSNLHRNVVFRSNQVPSLPISHFEEPTPRGLLRALDEGCNEGINGCEALSIPHNSNWSNGRMFTVESPGASGEVGDAERRGRLEPLMEVYQHKGDSECINGLTDLLGEPDEACDFEKLRFPPYEDCGDGVGGAGMIGLGCLSRRDYVRGILLEGLVEKRRIGVNPYKIGLMASTDTHNGTPGAVDEADYLGHFGSREALPPDRLTSEVPAGPRNGPGGLIAVWAEENTRESIFDAMMRRETYGTSGPRMAVRFFGGWDLPGDLCEGGDLVSRGYELGVPMGGDLGPGPEGGVPIFVAQAMADPGTADQPGTPLSRIQVIKGWLDPAGDSHIEVFDVAGEDTGASVDTASCEPSGAGFANLCSVWSDPEFDPQQDAYYYVRVLENPVCRWSTRDCNSLPPDEQPEACTDPLIPETIQERAWSSPIWYGP